MGTFPEWLTAIVAAVALWFAWSSNKTSQKMLKNEFSRDGKSEQLENMDQAAKISAVCAHDKDYEDSNNSRPQGILLSNRSTSPVYDLDVESIASWGDSQPRLNISVLPPGDYMVRLQKSNSDKWDIPDYCSDRMSRVSPIMRNSTWRVISVSFRDSKNLRWIRDESGIAGGA